MTIYQANALGMLGSFMRRFFMDLESAQVEVIAGKAVVSLITQDGSNMLFVMTSKQARALVTDLERAAVAMEAQADLKTIGYDVNDRF